MEWRNDGYNYDNKNNRVGYSGKPIGSIVFAGLLGKLSLIFLLIKGIDFISGKISKVFIGFLDNVFWILLFLFVLKIAKRIFQRRWP